MNTNKQRTTQDKINLHRRRLSGQENVYGTYNLKSGKARQVKKPVTDKVHFNHLKGKRPYGVYLLVGDRTRAAAVDFDEDNLELPMQFARAAQNYGIQAYIERSKAKGYHGWVFFPENGVLAAKARAVMQHILEEIEQPNVEIFPKHDALGGNTAYGNFINAPLFGKLVPKGRTVFLDPGNGLKPFPNQWDLLESIQTVSEELLDDIIEINDIAIQTKPVMSAKAKDDHAGKTPMVGLLPCARQMLNEGVADYQRVSCYRLAIHLRNVGIPIDAAIATLNTWALKNRPTNGKGIITREEIMAQAASAFNGRSRSYGCEHPAITIHCDPKCPLRGTKKEAAHARVAGNNNDGR